MDVIRTKRVVFLRFRRFRRHIAQARHARERNLPVIIQSRKSSNFSKKEMNVGTFGTWKPKLLSMPRYSLYRSRGWLVHCTTVRVLVV